MQIITAYANYLSERGLSEEICKEYDITWTPDGRLQIPVKDINGKVLFNKYRRNPYITTGPKYTYDFGSKASLFGADKLKTNATTVLVCEGELDAVLATQLLGPAIIGVSSTGGCGTWNEEWNELLAKKHVYILYDSDIPGVMGSIKVHNKIPNSRVLFLPQNMKMNPKDFTELFQKLGKDYIKIMQEWNKMAMNDQVINIPFDSVFEKQKTEAQMEWVDRLRALNQQKKDNYWAKIVLNHVNNLQSYKNIPKKSVTGGEDLTVAKGYKITDIVRFQQNKAKCIWHKDDSPSLTYYPSNNTVYCFGCQKAGDAVDVYMQVHNVNFKEAIKALNTS